MRSSVKMSRAVEGQQAGQSATDAEFRATFSLLPHLNQLLASLGQGDLPAIEKTVGELEGQLRRCHQLLSVSLYLDLSPNEQADLLERKRRELVEKSDLLMAYTDLSVLTNIR